MKTTAQIKFKFQNLSENSHIKSIGLLWILVIVYKRPFQNPLADTTELL